MGSLLIAETFTSIQGESTHAGRPCHFIRLAGCNLSCAYCDTPNAKTFKQGQLLSFAQILAAANASGFKLVEITGGEPLMQTETPALCAMLLENGFELLLETNGSLSIGQLPREVKKIVDCKTPSSGMTQYNHYDNYRLLESHDEIKFVITDRNDYVFAVNIIEKNALWGRAEKILFSPAWGKIDPKIIADWLIADRLAVRLHLQLQKFIWGALATGV